MGTTCAVLGAGSWGTALAIHLARCGHEVRLWDRSADRCAEMRARRANPRRLTDATFPASLRAEADPAAAVADAGLVVPAVPSHALRDVARRFDPWLPDDAVICCATKGLEPGTLRTVAEVLRESLRAALHARVTLLAGPSFAKEVAAGLPTAVVIAGPDPAAHVAADALHGEAFRAYHTDDVIGACIGGALKNVVAIACGVSDGLALGSNARAAIVTRGLAEISRVAEAMGGDPLTMMGLAGLGDLVLTCTGDLSRNRRVGLALAQGRALPEVLDELGEVAEGVGTAASAAALGRRLGVSMPITEQVVAVLHEGVPPKVALARLLARERKAERS